MDEEKPVFVRARVPQKTRARLKAACALQGRDMNDVIKELIDKWLQENDKPRGK